jgi:predicted kinase
VPGSGKSTLARQLASAVENSVICSTDAYFTTPEGVYVFDPKLLSANHAKNFRRAQALMDEGRTVVVDNTNIQVKPKQ